MRTRRQRRLAQKGAFDAVVAEYEGRLLRYAARLTSNPTAAEDVVQEAFLKLLRSWSDSLEPTPALQSWLYRVVHNAAVDHVRREARRSRLHRDQAEDHPGVAPPDRGAGSRVSDRALAADKALATLSERDRQLVVLKVYEQKRYREIAELTGLSVGNVGFILHHAMRKLAAQMRTESSG